MSLEEDLSGYENKSSWDVAVRFQDLQKFGHISDKEKQKLKRRAIQAVIEKAHSMLGSIPKSEKKSILNEQEFIQNGSRGDLDLLETIEEAGYLLNIKDQSSRNYLMYDAKVEKEFKLSILMDASLSMNGEKIALLAVAVAAVVMAVPSKNLSLMGFDSKERWIKYFGTEMSLEEIVQKVLELPAGGFTNLELAFEKIIQHLNKSKAKNARVILISDGKYTEGRDPLYLSKKIPSLSVLKIGRDQAGRDLLLLMSKNGNGHFFEAKKMLDLPKTLYQAMRFVMK